MTYSRRRSSHQERALGGRVWGTGNILAFDLGGGDMGIHFIVTL